MVYELLFNVFYVYIHSKCQSLQNLLATQIAINVLVQGDQEADIIFGDSP